MAKRVAVLVVNPVNGFGLFQYLEAFYENGIEFKTFAVSDSTHVASNSGIRMGLDDVVSNLKGREEEYDAVVFACGDAVPKINDHLEKSYYQDMFAILRRFEKKGKMLIGHCAAAWMFEMAGVGINKKVAIHPYGKDRITKAIATDEKSEIDGNLYTAQTENTIWTMMPEILKALM